MDQHDRSEGAEQHQQPKQPSDHSQTQMTFNRSTGQPAPQNTSQRRESSKASSSLRRDDDDASVVQEQKVIQQTDGGEFDLGRAVAAASSQPPASSQPQHQQQSHFPLQGEDDAVATGQLQPQDASDANQMNVGAAMFAATTGKPNPTSAVKRARGAGSSGIVAGGSGGGERPMRRQTTSRMVEQAQVGSEPQKQQQQVAKNLAIEPQGSSSKEQHDSSMILQHQQNSGQYTAAAFNSFHKDSDARSTSLVPDSLGNRPPMVSGGNKSHIDNFYRSKQAGNAHLSLMGAGQQSMSGIANGGLDNNRQRANSFNYTGAFAASNYLKVGRQQVMETMDQMVTRSGRDLRNGEERKASGSVMEGSRNNMSNHRQTEKESNSKDQPNSNNVLNSSMMERSRMLEKAEILSQQHLVMHAPINNAENPQRSLRGNQQSVSVNNFNINRYRADVLNNQIQMQQSQGGGGGFARGTIYKGGKNWKIGGMAANATFNNKTKQASNVPAATSNDLVNKSQNLTVYRQASASNNNSNIAYQNLRPPNEMALTAGSNFMHGGNPSNRVAQPDSNIYNQRQFKFSDAGSKRSFITHKRGLPRTLWQPGALFSTRMSRASVSAGKHVPHYIQNQNGFGMGLKDGGSLYNGIGQAPEVMLSGSHVNQFNVTHGTQGFTRQKYEQMAQNINRDINRKHMQQDANSALKIQKSNMSESGAYGVGFGGGGFAASRGYNQQYNHNAGAAREYYAQQNSNQGNQKQITGKKISIHDETHSKNSQGRALPRGNSRDLLQNNNDGDQEKPLLGGVDPSDPQRLRSHIEYNNSVFKNRPFSSENKYGARSIFRKHNKNILYGGQYVNMLDLNNRDAQFDISAYHDAGHLAVPGDDNQRATSALHKDRSLAGDQMPEHLVNADQYDQGPQSAGLRPKNRENRLNNEFFVLPPINQKPDQGQFGEVLGDFEGLNKVNNLEITGALSAHDANRSHLAISAAHPLDPRTALPIQQKKEPQDGGAGGYSYMTDKLPYPSQTNYEKKEERMLGQRVPEIIWLRVYHVTPVNKYLLEWLGFGFYHSSVELYNHEFAYGGHDYDFSGIVCVETIDENTNDPQKIAQASAASGGLELKERIPVGLTYYSMDEIDDIVIYFGNFWHGGDYDPFSKNCNNFAQAFISHISDKEQYYYPSYVNRFTKLGSVLRGWFKPLQTLFGEIVDLEQDIDEDEEEAARLNEFGYEDRRDNEFMAIPGGATAIIVNPSTAANAKASPKRLSNLVNEDVKPEDAILSKTSHQNIDMKAPDDKLTRQLSMISANQGLGATENMIASPTNNDNHMSIQKQRVFSPASQTEQRNQRDSSQNKQMSHTEQKTQTQQLDQLLSSPKQNIKVSQIIDITHQQMNHGNTSQVIGQGLNANLGDASNQNLPLLQSSDLPPQPPSHHHTPDAHHPDAVNAEDITARLYEKGGMPGQVMREKEEAKGMAATQQHSNMVSSNINNLAEEPVENIKARADDHFSHNQFQHAMKFYEICLGKITAVTEVDVHEDPYMMNLTVQTYIGICDSAHHLGLPDHIIHFATQCMKLDEKNTQNQMHTLLHKRARANLSQSKLQSAKQDLEAALSLLRVPCQQPRPPTYEQSQLPQVNEQVDGQNADTMRQIQEERQDIDAKSQQMAVLQQMSPPMESVVPADVEDPNSLREVVRQMQADWELVARRIKEEEQDDGSDQEQAEKSISKTKKELEDAEGNKAHASGDKTAGKDVANESPIKEDRGDKWTPKRGENAFKTDDDTDTELNLQKTLNEQVDKEPRPSDELLKRTLSPPSQHLIINYAGSMIQRQQSRTAVKGINSGAMNSSPIRDPDEKLANGRDEQADDGEGGGQGENGAAAGGGDEVGPSRNISRCPSYNQQSSLVPPTDLKQALEEQLLEVQQNGGRNQPQCKLTIKNELTMSQDTFQYRGSILKEPLGDGQRVGTPNVLPQAQMIETERETHQPPDFDESKRD